MTTVNFVLWGAQGFLAVFFLAAGAPKLIGRGFERWIGFSDLPRPMVVFIGVTEVLGAAGLVLPMATGFHLRADERVNALETGLWASIAAVIAIGRWDLVVAAHAYAPPWVLVLALGLLVPSVILNLIVLFKRPVVARVGGLEGLLPKAR